MIQRIFLFCVTFIFVGLSVSPLFAASRIVTLAPNLTDLVCTVAPYTLVGRATHNTVPQKASSVPEIGPYFRPDIERIAALKPDLCLAIQDGTPPHSIRRLHELGIKVHVLRINTIKDLTDAVLTVGELTNSPKQAQHLYARLQADIESIDNAVHKLRSRPLVLLQIQHAPPMFAGTNTFSDELIRRAGGRNLATLPGYPMLGLEYVVHAAPDVIIVTGMTQAENAAADWLRFSRMPAVRDKRVHIVPADAFSQATLRCADTLRTLYLLLHKHTVPDEPSKQKIY